MVRENVLKRSIYLFACAILLLVLVGCRGWLPENRRLNGRIIVWHSWNSTETAVFQEALRDFEEINPGVMVISVPLTQNELLPRFIQAAREGSGPDLLIGSDDWIQELADANLIRPYISQTTVPINGLAQQAVTYKGNLYGLPLFLSPYALYYNRTIVSGSLARTLDDLLTQAAEGRRVAFVPRFEDAYWGIRAFGPDIFARTGNLNLADSGFIPWLDWLSEIQNRPGVILNIDDASLEELFIQGRIAYYVAGPEKQAVFNAEMGEGSFGVTTLPSGPNGSASPLLPVETMMFYEFSSPDQAFLATTLAEFLANQQQGIRFMRELDKLPANPQISVDSRIYPNVSGFWRQSFTAVVLPNILDKSSLVTAGNRAYAATLSGALTPESAVCIFGQEIAAANGLTAEQVTLPPNCELPDTQP